MALSGGNPSNGVGLSARYDTAPGSVTNNGAITIASDGPAEIDDYTGGTGTITVTSNTLTLRPPAGTATTSLGNITVAAATTLALDAASNTVTTGGGAFILPAGKSITGAGTLVNSQPGAKFTLTIKGAVTTGALVNYGTIDVGTHRLTPKSYTQGNSGVLAIALASPTTFGSIETSGPSAIDGTLTVSLAGSYTPAVNITLPIINAASISGTFATINNPAGEIYTTSYTAKTTTIERTG